MIESKYGRKFLLEMMPKHSVCAEIGVSQGLFTEEILEVVQPKKLHLIDPWAGEPHIDYYGAVCEKFKDPIESGQVEIHKDKSQFVYDQFPDRILQREYCILLRYRRTHTFHLLDISSSQNDVLLRVIVMY